MAQVRIQHSFDTEENWQKYNPVLREGELVLSRYGGGDNVKLIAGISPGGSKYSESAVVWDKKEAEEAQRTAINLTSELSARLDNITASATTYYVQCGENDAGAMEVVADDNNELTEKQIKLAGVTPRLSSYVPQIGDYVRLAADAVGTEVTDIRIGADGKSYTSAGASVRGQFHRAMKHLFMTEEAALDCSWFTDAPANGYAWVTTYGAGSESAVSLYGYQEIYYVFSNVSYVRRYQEGEWRGWEEESEGAVKGRGPLEEGYDLNKLRKAGVYILTYGKSYLNAPPLAGGGVMLSLGTQVQIAYEFTKGDYWYRRGINCGSENESWSEWAHYGQGALGTGTYVAFGDSVTYGQCGSSTDNRTVYTYPSSIAKATGTTAVNIGVRGQGLIKAVGGKSAYDTIMDNEDKLSTADLITLSWGINDYASPLGTAADGHDALTICGRWNKVLEKVTASAPNAQIAVIAPLPTASSGWSGVMSGGWSLDTMEEAVSAICKKYNVPYITWRGCRIASNIGNNSEDGVHPTEFMYKRLGAYIAGMISKFFLNVNDL